jgi:hypothetical protein
MQISAEFDNADFGDARLTKRLRKMVERLVVKPSASFPAAVGSDAELEASYRFLRNTSVTPARIMAPHVAATLSRIASESLVIVAHDTTEFTFSTPRQGLGRINDAGQGFFAHAALAVSADGMRRPLGVVGLHTFTRQGPPKREKHTEQFAEEERESFRWKALATEVGDLLQGSAAIHVMDSEADAYELLDGLIDSGQRFVIRLKHDRKIRDDDDEQIRLSEKLLQLEGRFVREVQLSARSAPHHEKRGRKRNAARTARLSTLKFSATSATFIAPKNAGPNRPDLMVNIVCVDEINAPTGTEPVSWILVTTEPITTTAQIELIVDAYRARWLIEELFKALKTGCAFEKRQLESLPVLLNALAIFIPIAFDLLALRSAARTQPERLASTLLRPTQLLVLERHKNFRLPPRATARAALLAIAQLGGHIKNNGEPGWIVLGRGFQKLLDLEEGALAILNL